jgi:hypothetical protein
MVVGFFSSTFRLLNQAFRGTAPLVSDALPRSPQKLRDWLKLINIIDTGFTSSQAVQLAFSTEFLYASAKLNTCPEVPEIQVQPEGKLV